MLTSPDHDKMMEIARYEARGRKALTKEALLLSGAASLPPILRTPYIYYEELVSSVIYEGRRVLEIGAGMGEHTGALLQSGAQVTCLDIAPSALAKLEKRFSKATNPPEILIGDMENIPMPDSSFDIIVSAGSLSYGDPNVVDKEITRVLRPGGSVVCVDSLNHNWVYKLNRWWHFRRGHRTRSTLHRMPTIDRIQRLTTRFASSDIRFFGAMTWAAAAIAPLVGQEAAAKISDMIDMNFRVRRCAFKFVLRCEGLTK